MIDMIDTDMIHTEEQCWAKDVRDIREEKYREISRIVKAVYGP